MNCLSILYETYVVLTIFLPTFLFSGVKGCGMGPWVVLVSPCFRENVVATCKIGSFLCSLDNLLQKYVVVFFLEIKFQNGAHLKKGLFLTYFSLFLVTQLKVTKIPSAHISLTYIHVFCSPY